MCSGNAVVLPNITLRMYGFARLLPGGAPARLGWFGSLAWCLVLVADAGSAEADVRLQPPVQHAPLRPPPSSTQPAVQISRWIPVPGWVLSWALLYSDSLVAQNICYANPLEMGSTQQPGSLQVTAKH
jgi:hypothetical protein